MSNLFDGKKNKKNENGQQPLLINAMSFLSDNKPEKKEEEEKQIPVINEPLVIPEQNKEPDPVDALFEAAQKRYASAVQEVKDPEPQPKVAVMEEEEPDELRVFQANWQDIEGAEKASPERALRALNDGIIGVTLSFWHNGSVRATLKQHRFTLDRDHEATVKAPGGKGFLSGVYVRDNVQILVNYRPIVEGNYGRIYLLERISGKVVL